MGLSIWDGAPRTIQVEIDDWSNQSWGLHDVDRMTIRGEIAVSGNGSRMGKFDAEWFHYYLIRYSGRAYHTLYVLPIHSGYSIDDKNRIAYGGECACSWDAERQKPDDSNCSQSAAIRLPGGKRVGSSRIAGALVVQYRHVNDKGTIRQLSLAPEHGCEVMEDLQRSKGTLGIPSALRRYRVTSYRPGEPDKSLFVLPAGYRVEAAH